MSDDVNYSDTLPRLHQAIRDGDWDAIAQEIENDARLITIADAKGMTLLHRAVAVANEFIVARLLEYANCPLDAQEFSTGRSALHLAANKNSLPLIQLLLQVGANAQLVDNTEKLPLDLAFSNATMTALRTITLTPIISLRSAISEGAVVRVRRILANVPALITETDWRGCSLLCQAIEMGNQSLLAELISAGVPLTLADNNGQQPLSLAVALGKLTLVLPLLAAGADARSADHHHVTSLHLAAGHGDVSSNLLSTPARISAPPVNNGSQWAFDFTEEEVPVEEDFELLTVSTPAGDYPAIARALLASGAQVDAVANGGVTALHLAAACGDSEIVQLLLENHAPLDSLLNGWHATPALLAADNRQTETLQILLNAGADDTIRDAHGRSIADLLQK